jgi:hypothetical protein
MRAALKPPFQFACRICLVFDDVNDLEMHLTSTFFVGDDRQTVRNEDERRFDLGAVV